MLTNDLRNFVNLLTLAILISIVVPLLNLHKSLAPRNPIGAINYYE